MAALAYAVAAGGGLGAAVLGLAGLGGASVVVHAPGLVPLGGLELALDPLGGFFLALIGATTVPVSIYAAGHAAGERRGLLAYCVFVASMCAVPLAANVLTFLLAWELMSLASYVLVVQSGEREAVRAAWVYAVMTHAGLACLLAGMLLLGSWTGSFRFADWYAAAPSLPPGGAGLAFVLLAVGFGAKAGVIPLHVWLPLAHPATSPPPSPATKFAPSSREQHAELSHRMATPSHGNDDRRAVEHEIGALIVRRAESPPGSRSFERW